MFELIHNSILTSSFSNSSKSSKTLNTCNVCIGLPNLDRKSFPNATHSHSKDCILGLTLSWYTENPKALMLTNFFNLIYQQHQINPTETTNEYLKYIKGGGKVLLYWTLNELLKNESIQLNKEQTISIEVGSDDVESIHKLIHYYKSLSFIPIFEIQTFEYGYPMQSTIEKVVSSIDINHIINESEEMNTFYSFLQTQKIKN
jgi:hypothetical protein